MLRLNEQIYCGPFSAKGLALDSNVANSRFESGGLANELNATPTIANKTIPTLIVDILIWS